MAAFKSQALAALEEAKEAEIAERVGATVQAAQAQAYTRETALLQRVEQLHMQCEDVTQQLRREQHAFAALRASWEGPQDKVSQRHHRLCCR